MGSAAETTKQEQKCKLAGSHIIILKKKGLRLSLIPEILI
jgi:hypothetical protein